MSDQWDGPKVNRTRETANEHYSNQGELHTPRSTSSLIPMIQPPFLTMPSSKAAENHDHVAEVLNAERVRWKFNHDTEWNYGKALSYTEQPSYLIEREEDGVRMSVLASFNPEPVPEDAVQRILDETIAAFDQEHPMADPIGMTDLGKRLRDALSKEQS